MSWSTLKSVKIKPTRWCFESLKYVISVDFYNTHISNGKLEMQMEMQMAVLLHVESGSIRFVYDYDCCICHLHARHITFYLGVHRISNPAGIPAGFDEFSKSGIRPDFF